MKLKSSLLAAVLLPCSAVLLPCALLAQERVDLSVINRIRTEAFENSKVMEYMFQLTDVNGPRLAGSPGYRKAAEWSIKTLKEIGLEDAKLEKWGRLGRGWSCERWSIHMLAPHASQLIGIPEGWSPATNGAVAGEVVLAPISTESDLEKFRGKLKGRIVLAEPARTLELPTDPMATRLSEAELASTALAPDPGARGGRRPSRPAEFRTMEDYRKFRTKVNEFLRDEGVLAVLRSGARGFGGSVYSSASGTREPGEVQPPPTMSLMIEHYNLLARLVDKNTPVRVEVDIRAQFHDSDLDGYNVIGNLPGSARKDEVVMIGGHLDSWHGGSGASDNASGVAICMEALRILKAIGVKLDRTVRIGLWDAEEEGLLGSRGYVKEHFADPEKMELKKEHAKLAAYFNYDNGGGKIRGVYCQNNDMARPIFEAWLAPLKDLGAGTVTIRNTSGTDHLAFDAVGLPGFQFIQDPLDYMTRIHHSNLDTYDRLQPGDLMQSAAVMATFVYQAATRPEMLPRKPLPKPRKSEF